MSMMKHIRKTALSLAMTAVMALVGTSTFAAGGEVHIEKGDWSFNGPFGTYDRAELQRGMQVYKQVCAACHSLKRIAFRNLEDLDFSEAEVKAIAAEYQVTDGPDSYGDMFDRAARPSDYFPSPFANEEQGRAANNGAYPPDLSLVAKSRVGGPDYLKALLVGYVEAPADFTVPEGMHYNKAFPGNNIAMAQPLYEDSVEYADGTPATVEQMANDVSAFLMWAAEPKLEDRKSAGFKFMIYMVILTILLYLVKKKVWADVKKPKKS